MISENNLLRLITATEAQGVEMPPAASVKKRRNLKKERIEKIRNKYAMQQLKNQRQ